MHGWTSRGIAAVLLGFSAFTGTAMAHADEPAPVTPTNTSSSDELADMVMDAIENGAAAPSTSKVPAPNAGPNAG